MAGRGGRNSQQNEVEDYLSRIKLREIFQVGFFSKSIKTMICIVTTCNAGDANSCSSTST